MWYRTLLCAAVFAVAAGAAGARPATDDRPVSAEESGPVAWPGSGAVAGLSAGVLSDTVTYGGTVWAADSMRWEAVRGGVWTFETGIGSSINTGANPNKPIGWHQRMEGWFGIDQTVSDTPYFRRSTICAIHGSFSFWAGVTVAEAESLCYAAGQGYGNSWNLYLSKTFAYPGTGSAQFSYAYAVEAEPGFDYAYVTIDTTGNGSADPVDLAVYTGSVSGTALHTLTPGTSLRSTPGPVTITFNAQSDGSYSDEDGLNPTICGHTAIDDVTLSGAITDFSDFEAGPNGWAQEIPVTGIGDFSNLAFRGDLPPPQSFCPCATQDSVLVFFDDLLGHPMDQDNIAASPWIDLRRGGDYGRPLHLVLYSSYVELPIANYVFTQIRARYYPQVCAATGKLVYSRWLDQAVFYFGEEIGCNTTGTTRLRDYSAIIPPSAWEAQIGVGALNLCRTEPFGFPCSGETNTTPWFDRLALGVGGVAVAPAAALLTFDRLQDSFAEDGSLNPASTGRLDSNTIKDGSNPVPGTHLRDTMVVRVGSSTNTEVRIWFMVRPGPFTSTFTLAQQSFRWTPDPSIPPRPGAFRNTWFHARLDTAEQGGTVSAGNYMATFHEADPGFRGTDRTPDPFDPNQLENEILPDHLFTPGTRIDYFVATRWIPPDPRNVGGVNWFIEIDTAGGRTREVEILPSSTTADTTWNCVLYVDHHGDRSFDEAQIEEASLTAALGGGGANAEGTRFDRWDVETPSSGQLSLGRQIQTNYGASAVQLFAYKVLVWHCATLSSVVLTDEDANVIRPWLELGENHAFWGTGDGLVRSMNTSNETATLRFMKETLGVLASCNTIREANCPSGSILDSTSCLATTAVAGAAFATPTPTSAAGNGCRPLRSFDVNSVNPTVPTARGQLAWIKNGATVNDMSVTNEDAGPSGYRTVVDGAALGALRTTSASPNNLALCSADPTAAYDRTAAVLGWFGPPALCGIPAGVVSVPGDPPEGGAPPARTKLELAAPNPMNGATTIRFSAARNGTRVVIDILDVTGRLVKRLADAPFDAGPHAIAWDGTSGAGRPVSAGLYFCRMNADGKTEARKLVVNR